MDLLVKLYALPEIARREGEVSIRRAFAAEKHIVGAFVKEHFSIGWASECEIAFARQPISCFIAVADNRLCGFACYDATARAFFGPIGVAENSRGAGVGSALLLETLCDMRANGYGYAIVGAATNTRFYGAVGAVEIAGSEPGFYAHLLKVAEMAPLECL